MTTAVARLDRTTLRTSRLLDFCSRKELIAQTGHQPEAWPLVVLKELVDNALDACEEASTEPMIAVQVNETGIAVSDNGPGIPGGTIEAVLDFTIRVSSREAYVAPDRGAQGNALKTIVAMPFVLDGERGRIEVVANGVRHRITFGVDPIRQEPVIDHQTTEVDGRRRGTTGRLVYFPGPDNWIDMGSTHVGNLVGMGRSKTDIRADHVVSVFRLHGSERSY